MNFEELDVLDAAKEAARIIYAVHDESKDKLFELEMSWISPQSMYRHELVPAVLMKEAEAYAKQCLESQMED